VYIGSTTASLVQRFNRHLNSVSGCHRNFYDVYRDKDFIKNDLYIELIKNFECNTSLELRTEEQVCIDNNVWCVNAGRAVKRLDNWKQLEIDAIKLMNYEKNEMSKNDINI